MIGAIAGDIIGSVYERNPVKTKDFPLFNPACRFTDDSVLTIAVAGAILTDRDYRSRILETGRRYPNAGYGYSFQQWLMADNPIPYNSWGNGSAMRVSPIGFAFDNVSTVLEEADRSARISHDHPEGIKGAQATALAVFLARTTKDKTIIKKDIENRFNYDLGRSLVEISPSYTFDVSCQGSVPEAIIAFLESDSYIDAIRNAVALGGDSDTQACICGGIAEAYYGPVPEDITRIVKTLLTSELWSLVEQFYDRYMDF
jgi:ADP-ribosylglycohydrolase